MLIELQTLLVNKSILSKAQLLADDINQWTSVLSQSNPGDGKRLQRYTELNLMKGPHRVKVVCLDMKVGLFLYGRHSLTNNHSATSSLSSLHQAKCLFRVNDKLEDLLFPFIPQKQCCDYL